MVILKGASGKFFGEKPADSRVSDVLALMVSQAGILSPPLSPMGIAAGQVQSQWILDLSCLLKSPGRLEEQFRFFVCHWGTGLLFGTSHL